MRKQWFVLGVVALAALLATSTFAANRGVSFSGIGFIHPWDPGPYPASMVWGMTDDGQTLLTTPDWGGRYATLTTYPGLEWSLVGGCTGFSISGDGSAIMASAPDDEGMLRASVWNGTENDWTPLPYPDGFEACGSSGLSFYDMGGNAEYATGLTWEGCSSTGPFFWNAATNTTVKYDPVVGSSSDSARGNAITDDGSLIVGWNKQLCGMWRGGRWDDGVGSWIDGLDANEPKVCGQSGDPCCGDRDCPEYVDDGWCDKTGVECVDGFCVGGSTPGASCTSTYYCEGYCAGGPNQGDSCRSDYLCPDTQVCVENPDFDAEGMKGEAFDVTSDGSYIAGTLFGMSPYHWSDPLYDPYLMASGYRANPDGSFTQLEVPEGMYPDGQWIPIDMSDDGGVIGGKFGSFWSSVPTLWTEETGTLDVQYFLVAQGLDDLYFWYLGQVNTVRADGGMVGGYGTNYVNPDCHSQWGCTEGWVAEIAKASVCHKADEPAERTLTVAWDSLGDHLGHGDGLGTCEFLEGGGARAAEMRPEVTQVNGIDPDLDRTLESDEQRRARQGLTYGGQWAPDQPIQQDDETSSAGPAVQREDVRKRVRR